MMKRGARNPMERIDEVMGPRLRDIDDAMMRGGVLRDRNIPDMRGRLLVNNRRHLDTRPRLRPTAWGQVKTNASPRSS